MGGRNDVNEMLNHYETEKRYVIVGLNCADWKTVQSLIRKANLEQLSKLADEVLHERLKRCGV